MASDVILVQLSQIIIERFGRKRTIKYHPVTEIRINLKTTNIEKWAPESQIYFTEKNSFEFKQNISVTTQFQQPNDHHIYVFDLRVKKIINF